MTCPHKLPELGTFPGKTITLEIEVAPCGSQECDFWKCTQSEPYVSVSASIPIELGSGMDDLIEEAASAADSCVSYESGTLECEFKAELDGEAATKDVPIFALTTLQISLGLTGDFNALGIEVGLDICVAVPLIGDTCASDFFGEITAWETSTEIEIGVEGECPADELTTLAIVLIGVAGACVFSGASALVWWLSCARACCVAAGGQHQQVRTPLQRRRRPIKIKHSPQSRVRWQWRPSRASLLRNTPCR